MEAFGQWVEQEAGHEGEGGPGCAIDGDQGSVGSAGGGEKIARQGSDGCRIHKTEKRRKKKQGLRGRVASGKAGSPIQSDLGRHANRVGVLWHPKELP